jgi:hypothetical protein
MHRRQNPLGSKLQLDKLSRYNEYHYNIAYETASQ